MPPLIVTDSKYEFIPPLAGNLWPRVLTWFGFRMLRRKYGVTEVEVRGADKAIALREQGHSMLIAPNHCRMGDPLVLQHLARSMKTPFFFMASSHLFHGGRFSRFALRGMGAFSIYREGIDRTSIEAAVGMLSEAKRPLVIFPEGALNQANDRLNAMMEGVSFIAHSAARKVERRNRSSNNNHAAYIVPVALRYLFKGDIEQTVAPILSDIENRLSWRTHDSLPIVDRIYKVGNALMGLKETEYMGRPQMGSFEERLQNLIDHLLHPLEEEWLGGKREDSVVNRVKELRRAVVPEMIEEPDDDDGPSPPLTAEETERRWRQLEDMAFAQALSLFPPRYVATNPTVDRILETVERMAENLQQSEQVNPPMKAIVQVGDPIEVAGKRHRHAEQDPLLQQLEDSLVGMLNELSRESKVYTAHAQQ